VYDVIVVGGGPAGLSACLWLGRYRRRVLLIDSGKHRNRWVEQAHGYLGADPVSPRELLRTARGDLARYPTVEQRPGTVTAVGPDGAGGFLVTVDGSRWRARRLLLATGVRDDFPQVIGFFDHYGVQVFHCPSCDGYEAQGARVIVLGWSEQVTGFALGLLDWAHRVTLVTDGRRFQGDEACRATLEAHGVEIIEDDAEELVGTRGDLRGLRLRGGRTLDCEFAFFSIAHHPVRQLADQLGCELTEEGYVAVDEQGRTSVDGVWAAGDVTPGLQLIQAAAADGTAAGTCCALSLRGEPPLPGAAPTAPDVGREVTRTRGAG
jgi:thioredoxin reductase